MRHTRRDLLVLSGLTAGSLSGLVGRYGPVGGESDESDNATDEIEDDTEIDEIETVTELDIDFHDWNWLDEFTEREFVGRIDLVREDAYDERSLRVDIPEGSSEGTSLHYMFSEESSEPEELWASYYIYVPESFDAEDQVGKLPGPAGTYGRGGWGGRRSGGTNGWSARMGFRGDGSDEIGLQYYVYHADMEDDYGEFFIWDEGLTKGEWHRIDQYILLNDPDRSDGVLMGWVDGREAYDHRNIRFRETDELKIEDYWFNVYWGGMYDSQEDNSILFDNLRVRTSEDEEDEDSEDDEDVDDEDDEEEVDDEDDKEEVDDEDDEDEDSEDDEGDGNGEDEE